MSEVTLRSLIDEEGNILVKLAPNGSDVILLLVQQLKRVEVRIRDGKGGRVSFPGAFAMMVGQIKDWNETGMPEAAGSFHSIANRGQTIHPQMIKQYDLGFFVGTMFERLRKNKDLVVEIEKSTLTAEEMQKAVQEGRAS